MPSPLASCQFTFEPTVRMADVADTFDLAVFAAEALHGTDRVALDSVYKIDPDARAVEIDRSTNVGSTLALIFLAYIRREFGGDAFRMRRLHAALATGGEGAR